MVAVTMATSLCGLLPRSSGGGVQPVEKGFRLLERGREVAHHLLADEIDVSCHVDGQVRVRVEESDQRRPNCPQ